MLQVALHGTERAERRETAVGVVAVELEMFGNQGVQKLMAAGVELALLDQDAAKRLRLLVGPDVERGQQCRAIDEVVLKGQDAEQQVAGGVGIRRSR